MCVPLCVCVCVCVREREREREREKELPWQRKTRASGEEDEGNHLQVKSCTPLEFLMYS